MTGPVQDFRARFARLRDEHARGVSLEDLHYQARRRLEHRDAKAVSLSTLQKRLAPGAKLEATADLLVTLAAAVDVPPDEFPEYRLALARRQLDEREVGLDQALENLTRIEASLQRPRKAADREATPADTSQTPGQASPAARRRRAAT